MRLIEVQQAVRDAIIAGEAAPVAPLLTGPGDMIKRLAIHRRHYEGSLAMALAQKYPATAWLTGSSFLAEAARRFVHEHPPTKPCIAEYGDDFPEFLTMQNGSADLPYLGDFATLECHVGHVSLTVDSHTLSMSDVIGIQPDALVRATMFLQPGVRYLRTRWAVDELLRLYLSGNEPETFTLEMIDTRIEIRGSRGELQLRRLDEPTFLFRQAVQNGLTVGDAAEQALDGDGSFDAGQALAALLHEGLATGRRHGVRNEMVL
jgi:Putative DNA-binding domain